MRFDGAHRRDRFVIETLARHADLVPVCPEMAAGMGVPRPALRLVDAGDRERLVESRSGRDWTEPMTRRALALVADLSAAGLDGALLKRGSPSCGIARVRVYHPEAGAPVRLASGTFARTLDVEIPDLPMEDEGRLSDPHLRHQFLTRVFARARLTALWQPPWRARDVIAFHTREKLLLLAHRVETYQQLGRLVAQAGTLKPGELAGPYSVAYLRALAGPATRGRHVAALQHVAGFLRGHVADAVRRDLDRLILEYRRGRRSYLEPYSILRHTLRVAGLAAVGQQSYLQPYPDELMLETEGHADRL